MKFEGERKSVLPIVSGGVLVAAFGAAVIHYGGRVGQDYVADTRADMIHDGFEPIVVPDISIEDSAQIGVGNDCELNVDLTYSNEKDPRVGQTILQYTLSSNEKVFSFKNRADLEKRIGGNVCQALGE